MSDVRVHKDDTKEHTRLRRRVRKLEQLLMGWLALEDAYDRTQTTPQVERAAQAIQNYRAVVRRAVFR